MTNCIFEVKKKDIFEDKKVRLRAVRLRVSVLCSYSLS